MLFQHDPAEPIGVWTSLKEDARGLHARGRLMPEVTRAREVLALMRAGALEVSRSASAPCRAAATPAPASAACSRSTSGNSVVTFPLLPEARVAHVKSHGRHRLAASIAAATNLLRGAQLQSSPRGERNVSQSQRRPKVIKTKLLASVGSSPSLDPTYADGRPRPRFYSACATTSWPRIGAAFTTLSSRS